MNMWAEALGASHPRLLLCTYESLLHDAPRVFADALRFLGATVDDEALAHSVEYSRFQNLRVLEQTKREREGRSLDQDVFRFRQGRAGSHARELSEADQSYVNAIVSGHLDPVFAYQQAAQNQPSS